MPEPGFQRIQSKFTAHLRDPEHAPAPADVEDRRMKIYRELFYNNVESFIASGFPVLRRIYSDAAWHALVRDFFARHRCHTPFFHRIAAEFLDYLQNERGSRPEDPPFLFELAHYEWAELALGISDAEVEPSTLDGSGDLLISVPVVSPNAWNLAYRFPVHRISAESQPREAPPQPTHIVVYRDAQDHVGFLEINALTARLLQKIEEQPKLTGRALLEDMARELKHPDTDAVIESGREMLGFLRERNIILGTRV